MKKLIFAFAICGLCFTACKNTTKTTATEVESHEGHDHGSHEGHDHGTHEGHDHAATQEEVVVDTTAASTDAHEGHDHEGHDHDSHEGHDHN